MIRLQMTRLLLYNDDNDLFGRLHLAANTLQINLKEALCYEFILLAYNISIILKLKDHIKGRLILRILDFLKNLSSGLKIIR